MHTGNVAKAQNYNSRKFGLKYVLRQIGFRRIGKTPSCHTLAQWRFSPIWPVMF